MITATDAPGVSASAMASPTHKSMTCSMSSVVVVALGRIVGGNHSGGPGWKTAADDAPVRPLSPISSAGAISPTAIVKITRSPITNARMPTSPFE